MALAEDLRKRIERKRREIQDNQDLIRSIEEEIRVASSYIQALEDTLKLVPKDQLDSITVETKIRPGSMVAGARDALREVGRPLHVSDLLVAMKKENTKKNRLSLSSSLSQYARQHQIFTKPEPNTFGLAEWSIGDVDVVEQLENSEKQ